MGGNIKSDDIILLFDQYSSDSRNLHESFRAAGKNYPAAVIEDNGFLPEDVMSVYGFFLGDFASAPGTFGKPRYFNQIRVPEFWEISGSNSSGSIHDLEKERGRIFYSEPKHRRLVRVVDWYDDRGVVRSSDHYNRCGALYARTVFNAKGQRVNKTYFSAGGQEKIVENFVTGDIILNDGGKVRIFPARTDFILFFLKRAGLLRSRIFFNSLSTPFFVSQRLGGETKGDILFWQEPERKDIPGNMQIILNGQASRTARIYVQKRKAYDKLLELGADPAIVRKKGFIYSFKKENRHMPQALICTNSDRLEQCRRLAEALPQLHFHIAALTEMSPRLMSMGACDNVSLYPGVKMDVLDELFDQCDYYLDINYEGEIVSAVYQAFLHNQLIFAFRETIHNRDYVAEEHIYPASQVQQMIADLGAVLADNGLARVHLKKQKDTALAETVEDFGHITIEGWGE